ncbi:hypothetical protein K437DRAFT_113035 [Tilletiaria anomala UBC 951]|uniref:Uncharacterized protein n=1 Tax=Tilletiaria anomala (strain ATCC 24038 / CBS 436.72 / UBC 951) TaxID=1037660 RepID=A0A066W039_TILAU|nr:uncharacterized protein K437DRAFT_113035 [Tilletiaria anomala UBC 951]KDN45878.1 hypothetical protein K437DRAFT_113035 [Tilletiaria anomala UBC 951]
MMTLCRANRQQRWERRGEGAECEAARSLLLQGECEEQVVVIRLPLRADVSKAEDSGGAQLRQSDGFGARSANKAGVAERGVLKLCRLWP